MLKKKLKALNYLDWDKVDENDPQHFRKLIVWLEDQKIRHYKVEDRKKLREIKSTNWPTVFEQYCKDVNCPTRSDTLASLEWFIGHAIWLEYGRRYKECQQIAKKQENNVKSSNIPNVKSVNPLDNLNFHADEFIEGVNKIAELLKVTKHPNHLVTLEACSKLICDRLNANAIAHPTTEFPKEKLFPLFETNSNYKTGDAIFDKAVKILNFLYIQDLRKLQTKINEAIVSAQNITADPKTDTKLGKVGK